MIMILPIYIVYQAVLLKSQAKIGLVFKKNIILVTSSGFVYGNDIKVLWTNRLLAIVNTYVVIMLGVITYNIMQIQFSGEKQNEDDH
jgi:hypothetical protein